MENDCIKKQLPVFTFDGTHHLETIWPLYVFPLINRSLPLWWLEIGSFEGRSALWTIEHVFQNPGSRIMCIDTWGNNIPNYVTEMVFDENTNGIPQVVKRKGMSSYILPTLERQSFHGVYVDGSHTEEDVLCDARLSLPLLSPGGVIIFDDYLLGSGSGVKRAVDVFLRENEFKVTKIFQGYQVIAIAN